MDNNTFEYLIFVACFPPQSVLVELLADKTDEYRRGKTDFEDIAQISTILYLRHTVSDIEDPEKRAKKLRSKFKEATSMANLMNFEKQ